MRPIAFALAALLPAGALAALDVAGLDKSVDPCGDFYAYVNGKWLQAAVIPADRPDWGSFRILDENNLRTLKDALDDALKAMPADGSGRQKALQYYASGMDLKGIEQAGLAPLRPRLDRIAGIRGSNDLPSVFASLQSGGIEAPFSFAVQQDLRDATRYMPTLSQAGLGLPDRDAYFRDDARSKEVREAYRKYVAKILVLAGDPAQSAAEQAEKIYAFEEELAKASMTPAERRDVDRTHNRRTLAQLATEAPGFDWGAYFATLGLKDTGEINIGQPAFAKAAAALAASRPAADWRVYLRWHLLRASAARLPEAFAQAAFEFNDRLLAGTKERPPRWRQVALIVGGRYGSEPMSQGLGEIFVERAFPPEAKARVLALVANVKSALGERLKSLEWMSDDTRSKALEKLAAMNVKMGYPDKWRDFTDADVGPYPFVDNWLRANEFRHRRDLARIGRPVDRDEWFSSPQIVNAFYNGRLNEIVFPAGILQPPFFDPKADDAVNYGGIGAVIGHEITHGFDDRGRRFDAKGNLHDWWTPEDARRYMERAARVEKQFDAFVGVEGIHVNGKLTLGENISDLGGIKISYLALQKALQSKPQAPIDGLTADQRFFLSFATVWRYRASDAQEALFLRTDGHSPPRFRVNGPLAHMPEFARAFSCDAAKTLTSGEARAAIW